MANYVVRLTAIAYAEKWVIVSVVLVFKQVSLDSSMKAGHFLVYGS